jgi:hypothetical protein
MYKGHVGIGLLWLFFVVVGYVLFVVPGSGSGRVPGIVG